MSRHRNATLITRQRVRLPDGREVHARITPSWVAGDWAEDRFGRGVLGVSRSRATRPGRSLSWLNGND